VDPPAPQRLPVPPAEAQADVVTQLEGVYQLGKARSPAEKLVLAGEMIALGKQSPDNPAERFVLWLEATKLATAAGNAALVVEAIDAVAADFEVDALAAKQKMLPTVAAAAVDAERLGKLANVSLAVAEESLKAGQYDAACQLVEAAYRACQTPAGRDYRKRLFDRRAELQQLEQMRQEFQQALATLKMSPDDAAANLTVGRWYGFQEGDWKKALPHMAKGSDAVLRLAASLTLATPTDVDAQVAAGDAWWAAAEEADGKTKAALLHEAGCWYGRARPNVKSVLVKGKLAKRLAEIAKVEPPATTIAMSLQRFLTAEPATRPAELKRFDVAAAQHQFKLLGHSQNVCAVAFRPDGLKLLSGSEDTVAKFWDLATKQSKIKISVDRPVTCVAFSPDGTWLALSGQAEHIALCKARGDPVGTLKGHTSHVQSVAFHPNGTLLASGSSDGTVKIWDVATLSLQATWNGDQGEVFSVAFSPDGSMLASGGGDRAVRIWDVASGQILRTLDPHAAAIRAVAFSPDGSIVASASADRTVRLYDVATGQHSHTLTGHPQQVNGLAFHPDGSLLATAGDDPSVRMWSVPDGQFQGTVEAVGKGFVKAVAFSPDGALLALGTSSHAVEVWGADGSLAQPQPPTTSRPPAAVTPPSTAKPLATLREHRARIWCLSFHPRGTILASSGGDKRVVFWDVAKRQMRGALPPFRVGGVRVAYDPKGRWLAASSAIGQVRLYDAADAQFRRMLNGDEIRTICLAFNPDGSLLATAGNDKKLILWNVASGRAERVIEHPGRNPVFHPDGKLVATASGTSYQFWEVATGELVRTIKTPIFGGHYCIAFSPDGSLLAGGGLTKVHFYDTKTWKLIRSIEAHKRDCDSVAFSPDGATLASGSTAVDGTIKLWDADTGALRATLSEQAGSVTVLAFSPDGKLLASGHEDGRINLWSVDPSKTATSPASRGGG